MRPDRRIGSDFSPARPNARQRASSSRQQQSGAWLSKSIARRPANLVKCELTGTEK